MVYPQSPFTNKFDSGSLNCLKETNDTADKKQDVHLEKLLKWLCTSPKISSYRINTEKYSLEHAKKLITSELKKVVASDDINELVSFHPILREVILIKCLSDKNELRRLEKEIIVDAYCGTAILRGSHIFAPGVLAMETGTQKGDMVSIYVDTTKKCKKGLKIKLECSSKIFIGNGQVEMTRHELFGENLEPRGIAITMKETISRIPPIDQTYIPVDCMLLQNIPSIVCGYVLNPKPNELILDMCASPGNKTTHLGLKIHQGTIVAIDKTQKKVAQLRQNCDKYMLSCIHTFVYDSTRLHDKSIEFKNMDISQGPPFCAELFDKILLDAPCSNLGRRPQFLNDITNKEARSYVPLQRKLFMNAVKLLKPGGHLVYSTCTISLAENEGIVSWALGTFSCLELRLAEPVLGSVGWSGTNLTEDQRKLVQRFGPDDETDSVGFFIAHFFKK